MGAACAHCKMVGKGFNLHAIFIMLPRVSAAGAGAGDA